MLILEYLKSKIFWRSVILMLLIVIVGLFALNRFLNSFTHHDEKIQVPDLAKMSFDEADQALKALNLEAVVIDSASFNPDYPPRSVIEFDPEAGDYVKEDRKIYITLNPSGYGKIAVPNVLDKTKRQVETHLKSIGFRIGKYEYIPDLGKDVVRRMKFGGKELQPGDMIPKNSAIDLVLGDGNGQERSAKDSIE
ncbi:MAG: PASTA domain-containing protein [Flavobacteriaceae bacterium]|nr:PASTA domain-containing protein [Flavobacteriaceae bacterium]MCB0475013.1 PASTA domain-containing protein [Flavobacteriaceae bacterium]